MTNDPCTVLLIGAAGSNQRIFRDMLAKARGMKFTLMAVDSVACGVRCLATAGIDIIIYDLGTSVDTAVPAVRQLRRAAYDIPILVVTDIDDPDAAVAAIREGADEHLLKDNLHAVSLERVIRHAIARNAFRHNRQAFRSRLNTLITNNADAIVVVSFGGMIRFVNPAAEAMFSRKLEALIGTPFGYPITGSGRTEIDIIRPGERSLIAEMHLVIAEWGDEQVYLATLRDITERKANEGALRKYERIFMSFSDPTAVIDYARQVEMANQSFYRWFWPEGAPRDAGQLADVLAPGFYEETIVPALLRCTAGEENQIQTWVELPDGRKKYTTMAFDPFLDEDQTVTGCIWTIRDLSETKNLEDQLLQSQKMEAIGTLAGGIAHNFNNLLMGIQGRSSLMLMDTGPDHPFNEHLHGIESLVKEAAGLTKQLLGYARGGKYDPVPTELNALVAKNLRMFASTRKELEITEEYAPGLWQVEADQSQISQVLLNIFVNAWQAMPEGGRLTVTTTNTNLSALAAESYGVVPGRYVVIHVADTGRGMARATVQRIFDPFFTTKRAGRGTGLGLASAYGIIRNHNGFIDVDSEIARGSRFSIFLPATDKKVFSPSEARQRVIKGSETILLVDDEPDILEIGCQLMVRLGYKVRAVGSGVEALRVYQAYHATIDLIVLDLIMPGMGGGETFDRLREFDPLVKVLLASGYSLEGKAEQIMARGCDGFIQKPFDISELSVKLRSLLRPG